MLLVAIESLAAALKTYAAAKCGFIVSYVFGSSCAFATFHQNIFVLLQHFSKTSLEQLINIVSGKSNSSKCHILQCIRTYKTVLRYVSNYKMSEYKNKLTIKKKRRARWWSVYWKRILYVLVAMLYSWRKSASEAFITETLCKGKHCVSDVSSRLLNFS